MLGARITLYFLIFLTCSGIGMQVSKKYEERVFELEEFKSALNMFIAKLKFTYEPIPEIFEQISKSIHSKPGKIFKLASINMKYVTAGDAWEKAVDLDLLSINNEDRSVLKNLSKLLGQTDIEGQVNQIKLTSSFLDKQIEKAEKERTRCDRLYKTLGMIIGLAIVIILL